jgi:uncharacterized FAD-dependent dehydrogenase
MVTQILGELLLKRRIFSPSHDLQDVTAMLYAAAIMKYTEEPGWRVKHVKVATGLSEQASEEVLKVIENHIGTVDALISALQWIENLYNLSAEELKLLRSYRIRRINMPKTQQEYPVEFRGQELKNEYLIQDVCYGNGRWMTKMTTRIMTNDGIVTIFWE